MLRFNALVIGMSANRNWGEQWKAAPRKQGVAVQVTVLSILWEAEGAHIYVLGDNQASFLVVHADVTLQK